MSMTCGTKQGAEVGAGWPLHRVSAFLGHANITTTARYLNVKDDYLQKLIERPSLVLVRN